MEQDFVQGSEEENFGAQLTLEGLGTLTCITLQSSTFTYVSVAVHLPTESYSRFCSLAVEG